MFLLLSVRHVGAHPGEHQHGVSIQISINLGKTFLRISRIRNIPLIWILARVFAYLPPLICQILDLIYWTVLIFILIYFEWRDTENHQFHFNLPLTKDVRRSDFGKPLFLSIKNSVNRFLLFISVHWRFPVPALVEYLARNTRIAGPRS